MFLTDDDYTIVCDQQDLDIIQNGDQEKRIRAELAAMEEVAGFLRSRYDIETAYKAEGDQRNSFLVEAVVNFTLYKLIHALPQNMGMDARKDLYDTTKETLKLVQAGRHELKLPTYTGSNGEPDVQNPMRFGSLTPNKYEY